MKNYWLDKKEKKKEEARKLWDEVSSVRARRAALTRYKKIDKKLGKKPCGCSEIKVHKGEPEHLNVSKKTITINKRFLEEAKTLENRWAKSGLLDGITNKWDRSVTAVLLEGQRLMNEQKYNLYARTVNTGRRHGFGTLEEMYQHISVLESDKNYQVSYGNAEPMVEGQMILTVTENWTHPDEKDISYDTMLGYADWADKRK